MTNQEALWDTAALVAATGGRPVGALPASVSGLSIDSRSITPGDAFLAIKGERFDGHNFLTAATKAGAALHIVSEKKLPALGRMTTPLIVVDDVLAALGRIADAARARSQARIVAVTGSVGKTTTKEALRHALSPSGLVHASAASFNNHWGVPLSLARMPAEARFGVFEIGMNHPGEIRPLVKQVRPDAAVITLIAPAHLGFFRDIDEIAEAKAEIFEGLVPGGVAILNADDPQFPNLVRMARAAGVERIATFGEAEGADARLVRYQTSPDGPLVEVAIDGRIVVFGLSSPGRHLVQNILAVLLVAQLMGADLGAAVEALASWRAGKGRGERTTLRAPKGGRMLLIDESYNANPASMRAALEGLGAVPMGKSTARRIAVLGDMLELGEHSPALHAALAEPIATARVDRLILVGPEMKALDDVVAGGPAHCTWFETVDEAQAVLVSEMKAGDAVMVKASKSIGFAGLVEHLVEAFANEAARPGGSSAEGGR